MNRATRYCGFDANMVTVVGLVSAARASLSKLASGSWKAVLAIETGVLRGHIVAQNLTYAAAKILVQLAAVWRSHVSPNEPFVHPTAVIEPGAVIGRGTSIWHQSHLRSGAVIGAGCTLGKNVFVDQGVHIGDRVKVQNNVSVYRGVELANEVFIGPSVVFTNDMLPRAMSADWQLTRTRVKRGASVGANATIICGVEIGESAMVGAGSVVTSSVHPHQLVVGNPARHHGWVCGCGAIISRDRAQPAGLQCSHCAQDNRGADTVTADRITLAKVDLRVEEQAAVIDVLRSGQLAAGKWVTQLEESFAREHEVGHAVAVSSGTTALVAGLRAHQIGPGNEVITSPLTFVATLNAIIEVGATARFADISEDLTLDPDSVRSLLSPSTKALMPVHLYGLPAQMDALSNIAQQYGLVVIEDAAQAYGARVLGKPVGSWGTAAFSLYATKNITCGEGGVVTTDSTEIAARLRLLRNHGMRARYDYVLPGYNYRLTDLQAAIACMQVNRLPEISSARRSNAARLSGGLAGLPGLVLPGEPHDRSHAWHQYTVQVTPDARVDRDQLQKCLDLAGIDSMAYYPRLVHDYPCYQDHPHVGQDQTPRAKRAAREVLSLPVHPSLTSNDLTRIVMCIRDALG